MAINSQGVELINHAAGSGLIDFLAAQHSNDCRLHLDVQVAGSVQRSVCVCEALSQQLIVGPCEKHPHGYGGVDDGH